MTKVFSVCVRGVVLLVVVVVCSRSRVASLSERDHLVGPVVKASASGADDPGFESRLRRDFSGSSHTNDLKNMAILPGAWHYRVSAGTGRPGVSIL